MTLALDRDAAATLGLDASELRGPTLCSLAEAGAAVFRVEEVGSALRGEVRRGELRLCLGPPRSWQQVPAHRALAVPAALAPERAVLAPLLAPSLSALMSTRARPGELVMIRGEGPAGWLAARLFTLAGFEVRVVAAGAACVGTVARVLDCSQPLRALPDADWLRMAMNCLVDEQQIVVDERLFPIVDWRETAR